MPHGATVRIATKRRKTCIITGSTYKKEVGDWQNAFQPTGSKKRGHTKTDNASKKTKTEKLDCNTISVLFGILFHQQKR